MSDYIVNHSGILHEKVSCEYHSYDEYITVNCPPLKYSSYVRSTIRVTNDGRLYDVELNKYFESYNNADEIIDISHLQFSDVIVDVTNTNILALTVDGALYSNHKLNDRIGPLYTGFDVIDHDVQFISKDVNGNPISIKKNKITIYDSTGSQSHITIAEIDQFTQLKSGLPITDSKIVVILDDGKYEIVSYSGELIGCCVMVTYNLACGAANRYVGVIQHSYGELTTRCRPLEINIDDNIYDDEVINHQLVRMHQSIPWTEVIIINDHPYLVNREGVIVEVREDWSIIGTNIPPYIFDQSPLLSINLDQ